MHIRDAIVEDLPAIVGIYNSTVSTRVVTADTEPVSVASRQKWFADHSPARRPLWVAQESGQIAGWLSYSSFYGRPAYDSTCEVSLYLAPQHRGRGLGTRMLLRCIEHAPLIMVLGHASCGAVAATIKGGELAGHLPCIADAIRPAVEKTKGQQGDAVSNAAKANAQMVVDQLRSCKPVLAPLVRSGDLKVAAAFYDIGSGQVELL